MSPLPFDRRMTEDQIQDLNRERIERLAELDARREDRNLHVIEECRGIIPQSDIDIGV